MRFSEIKTIIADLAGGMAQRVERDPSPPPFGDHDEAFEAMIDDPTGSTFVQPLTTNKDVLVDVEPNLNVVGEGYAVCTPKIRDPEDPIDSHAVLPRFHVQSPGQFMYPMSFWVPAGWEYSFQLDTDGVSGSSAEIQTLYETPLS
jgi:hypothetical protein